MNNKKGFTLIEVLIVVSIIGILASIILVGLGAFRSRGRDTRRLADVRQVQGALELYYSKNGSYPAGGYTAVKTATEGPTPGLGIAKLPNDPNPSSNYLYQTNGQSYVLGAALEDGTNAALNDDIDAIPSGFSGDAGLNCLDANKQYCVQF